MDYIRQKFKSTLETSIRIVLSFRKEMSVMYLRGLNVGALNTTEMLGTDGECIEKQGWFEGLAGGLRK